MQIMEYLTDRRSIERIRIFKTGGLKRLQTVDQLAKKILVVGLRGDLNKSGSDVIALELGWSSAAPPFDQSHGG